MVVTGRAVQTAAGSLQLCAGQAASCEAAVHAIRELFEDESSDGVLLVDASNAFNSLNGAVALRNIEHLCPVMAPIIINTYRHQAELFVMGEVIFS